MDDQIPAALLTPGEVAIQQQAIERQRAIANLLQQQSFQEPQGQMVGGRFIAPSWTQQGARLANGLMGSMQQRTLDDKASGLARAQGDALRSAFGMTGQAPATTQPQPPVMPLGSGMSGLDNNSITGDDKLANSLMSGIQQPATPVGGQVPSRVIPGMNPMQAFQLYNSDPKTYDAAFLKQFDPTDTQKDDRYLGISPTETRASVIAKRQKEGYIPDENVRPGSTLVNAITKIPFFNAPNANGTQYSYDSKGNAAANVVPGAMAAIEAESKARAAGPATYHQVPVFNKATNQVEYQPSTAVTAAATGKGAINAPSNIDPNFLKAVISTESNGNPNAVSPKGAQGLMQTMPGTLASPGFGVTPAKDNSPDEQARVGTDYLSAMHGKYGGNQTLAAIAYNMGPAATDKWLASGGDFSKLPAETKNYVASVNTKAAVLGSQNPQPTSTTQPQQSGAMAAAPPIGTPEAIKGTVDAVNKHYEGLATTNDKAGQDINALQNIKKYSKGAITGAQADSREYLNGLASLVPGWNSAMDKKTETDLLNKNAQRIVGSEGSTSNATDALRTIIAGANPNNKMSQDAINQASDQLIAIKNMNLAAQKVLDPLKTSNDVNGYQAARSQFARNADPLIFQLKTMPPADAVKLDAKLKAQDPAAYAALMQKAAALKQLGAL